MSSPQTTKQPESVVASPSPSPSISPSPSPSPSPFASPSPSVKPSPSVGRKTFDETYASLNASCVKGLKAASVTAIPADGRSLAEDRKLYGELMDIVGTISEEDLFKFMVKFAINDNGGLEAAITWPTGQAEKICKNAYPKVRTDMFEGLAEIKQTLQSLQNENN